ncbi:DgyrCDS573 [Dimorphilus gyrociliatus]|uniref:DgyrCDS573 n=1 Tax=Dimorphilus gyrociliatus TaxID=2664684 RepID=A0A7I8V4U5_9ANNE|nr:DgyrCDS573 [Dimorphilus gyrociliatus]
MILIWYLFPAESEGSSKDQMKWMYSGDKVDEEEYLLGKKIPDKHFLKDEKEKPETVPGSNFDDVIKRRTELDMQAKMKEDPFFMIKQKEEEAKKRLLQNPIKLKELQKIVQKPKKEKKKKKKKKRRDSSSDSGDEIYKKYLELVKKKEEKEKERKRKRSKSPEIKHKKSHKTKKLTEEEKERKRQDMMKNAKWREEERNESIKRHKEQEKKEEERLNERRKNLYLSHMMADHANSSTVEDRLRRNRHNLQKRSGDFDSKFAKR